MASTERRSPLAGWEASFTRASASRQAFSIRERPFVTQVNLRGDASNPTFMAAVRAAIGYELPVHANTFAGTGEAAAILWLGPNEWLIVDQPDRVEAIMRALRTALGGLHHAVTDVSSTRAVIEIAGADARLVLAKGCPLDVSAAAFAPPRSAQSLLAKARVLIQCVDPAPTFRLYVPASFASYLAEWIVDAAAECAASRALGIDRIGARLE